MSPENKRIINRVMASVVVAGAGLLAPACTEANGQSPTPIVTEAPTREPDEFDRLTAIATDKPSPTPEVSPLPSPTPLSEKLFAGGPVESTEEQQSSLEIQMFEVVPQLSKFASEGFLGGYEITEEASSEAQRLAHNGYMVNIYPLQPSGVELQPQIDAGSGLAKLVSVIRDENSPNDGAVVVDYEGQPMFLTAQTEGGAVQWDFERKTYVSVSEELKVTHFVDPESGTWVEVEKGEEVSEAEAKEVISEYVAKISEDLGTELFLVPLSGEALSEFEDSAWALINLEEKNKLCNVFWDRNTSRVMVQFYSNAGENLRVPLQSLIVNETQLTLRTEDDNYVNPENLYWENAETANIVLSESVDLSQLPIETRRAIDEFFQGKEYSEETKAEFAPNFTPSDVKSGLGILELRKTKNAFVQGINLGIMTPEETRNYFEIYDTESYLVWVGHENRDGERIVVPYAIPREQFEVIVNIKTMTNPGGYYDLSPSTETIYNKSQQGEFVTEINGMNGKYIILQIFTPEFIRWPEARGSNLKMITILDTPIDPDNIPSNSNLGLEHLKTINETLERYEPVDLPVIAAGTQEMRTSINPPIIATIYKLPNDTNR